MTAINVGANVGYTSLVLAAAVGPSGCVLALEPEPLNFQLLHLNIERSRVTNVVPIHAAAGDHTGSARMLRSPDNSGDHRTAPHPVGIAGLDVPVVALDDLLPDDAHVNFVSCDAQGFDHRVVSGASKLIARCRPTVLVEFWPPGILELGDNPAVVVDEYRRLGYDLTIVATGESMGDRPASHVIDATFAAGKDHVTLALTAVTGATT
jgi:FkbM family methyltransferase